MSALPEAWAGGWGFVSGIGPADLENPSVALPESVEDQTRKIFSNLEQLLRPADFREGLDLIPGLAHARGDGPAPPQICPMRSYRS